jgi:hypothetical protein
MEWSTSDTIAVVSALAALFSAIYARKTYTATEDLKKHDFALQLQTATETLRAAVRELPGLLKWANRSHKSMLFDLGHANSSVWKKWEERFAEIEREIASLEKQVPSTDTKGLGLTDMREQIVTVHSFQVRATAVKAELNDMLQRDERNRQQWEERKRAEAAARASTLPRL